MKRKLIALLMAICCVTAGFAGCGDADGNDRSEKSTDKDRSEKSTDNDKSEKSTDNDISLKNIFGGGSGISVVTVEGEKYDLSDDFQKVVGKMAENGLYPVDDLKGVVYDEDGKWLKEWNSSDYTDSAIDISVMELPRGSESAIIYDKYTFGGYYDCTFETSDGITQDSDEDDLKELEGYVPYKNIVNVDSEACIALYVDGKIVDLEEYREEYEEWLKDAKEEGVKNAMNERVDVNYTATCCQVSRYLSLNVELETAMEEVPYFENDMLLVFAVQEACEKLVAGKIDSFDTVRYACVLPQGIMFEFVHYFYDENWDYNKFRKEEQ